jgi:hypothetical protein
MPRATSRLALCVLAALMAAPVAGCGDDTQGDVGQVCTSETRLAFEGGVGPTTFPRSQLAAPFLAAAGDEFFGVVLEDGDTPHRIVFSTRGQTGASNFRDALRLRIDSAASDAATLEVVARPDSVPCDPAEGVICAAYGIDQNGDGQLVGSNEVIYPVAAGGDRGTLTLTTVTGNTLAGSFAIDFGPQTSGAPEGGAEGGSLTGCFVLNLSPSLDRVD